MVELLSAPSNHSNPVRFPADLLLDLRFAIAPLCQFGASTAPITWRLRSTFLGALLQHLPAKIRLFKLPFNSVQCMFYLMYQSVFAQKRSKVVWQALCGSCLWIAIADFSGRLMTFVYCFVCACQIVCKISSEKTQKTYQDFQTFYCQKPCLFKVRLPYATNFQKNKLNHLSTFNESKISPK